MNREVVKELIQDDLTVHNLTLELKKVLTDPDRRAALKKDYSALRNLLNLGGNASANAAKSIYQYLGAGKEMVDVKR